MEKAVFNRLVGRVPDLRVLSPSRTYFDPYEQEVVCEFETTDEYITLKELKLVKDGVDSYINKITHPEDKHLLWYCLSFDKVFSLWYTIVRGVETWRNC